MAVKCSGCGGKLKLWSLSGKLEKNVKTDGACLICESCGLVQPDEVLRQVLEKK